MLRRVTALGAVQWRLRGAAKIGAGLLLVACGACLGPRPARPPAGLSNRSCAVVDANATAARYVRVPTPELRPDVGPILMLAYGEAVQQVKLCAADGSAVLASDWGRALEKDQFAVQVADSGWEGRGPLALRFRKEEVIGDVFGSADARGCRNYIIRVQGAAGTDAVHWSSPFGGSSQLDGSSNLKARFHRCIRFFSDDTRFPIDAAEYSWGCP